VKSQFVSKYYNGNRADGRSQDHCQSVDLPFPTIKTTDSTAIITAKTQFISSQYNSNGKPGANNHDIEGPLPSCTTEEKFQFITAYFNSGGHPESQNQSIEKPINSLLADRNKHALVTVQCDGLVDFDIKMRFIKHQEASAIMGFPEGYFTRPGLNLSNKKIFKMVGNAVPVGMAKALIEITVPQFETFKTQSIAV
jgi:site-specific DNA-cytosine methylase